MVASGQGVGDEAERPNDDSGKVDRTDGVPESAPAGGQAAPADHVDQAEQGDQGAAPTADETPDPQPSTAPTPDETPDPRSSIGGYPVPEQVTYPSPGQIPYPAAPAEPQGTEPPTGQTAVEPVTPAEQKKPGNGFSIAALALGGLAALIAPLVVGPAAILLGVLGKRRAEPLGTIALRVAIAGTAIGLVLSVVIVLLR